MVQLDGSYRLDNDERCFILQRRTEKGWTNISYPSTLESGIKKYHDICLKTHIKTDRTVKIGELITYIKKLNKAQLEAIKATVGNSDE